MNTVSPIIIKEIIVHRLVMRLQSPFTTSFGTIQDKELFIVEVKDEEGRSGFGESVTLTSPLYSEETVKTNEHIMEDFLIPLLLREPLNHPDEVTERFGPIRRHPMAKSVLVCAVWDLYSKRLGVTLAGALGGDKQQIDVGISIGIQPSIPQLLKLIEKYAAEGYKRIKIKIKPGWDVEIVKAVRSEFPSIPLMADANSAYTLKDIEHLKQLDDYNLTMIEQPLAHDDIIDHAKLQKVMETPICLDESIHSLEDARKAVELGSCRVINIKIGRVGGLTVSRSIHDYCAQQGIPVWCGGMLEAGVGRAHNIALTALSNFILPGDTAASSRYWDHDIIEPEVTVMNGVIEVPHRPGIGYEINWKVLESCRIGRKIFRK